MPQSERGPEKGLFTLERRTCYFLFARLFAVFLRAVFFAPVFFAALARFAVLRRAVFFLAPVFFAALARLARFFAGFLAAFFLAGTRPHLPTADHASH
jgi:hypothetical protein